MVAPEAEVPEAILRSPRYFSPGGFRIGSAARHRAQARGGQGEDQADPQQQIGWGSGTAATPDPDVHREFVSMAPAPQVET